MSRYAFKNALFIKTAIKPKDYPLLKDSSGSQLPEIAVVGRSNVGKSSLLNHLFQSKKLVKTSSVPGKTQALNFFYVDEQLIFVDLPGYGYAKVPLEMKKQWKPMIEAYLQKREALQLILFLFDIRRLPNQEDLTLMHWLVDQGKAVILILTKVDKVSGNERKVNAQEILKKFNLLNLHCIHYSTTKNIGRKELIYSLNDALDNYA